MAPSDQHIMPGHIMPGHGSIFPVEQVDD